MFPALAALGRGLRLLPSGGAAAAGWGGLAATAGVRQGAREPFPASLGGQARPVVTVEVNRDNVDQACRLLFKKLKEEGLEKRFKEVSVHVGAAERRKLDKKETERRLQKREYKRLLGWVMRRKMR